MITCTLKNNRIHVPHKAIALPTADDLEHSIDDYLELRKTYIVGAETVL